MSPQSTLRTRLARYGIWAPMAWFSWVNTHIPTLPESLIWLHPYFWFAVSMAVLIALGMLGVHIPEQRTKTLGRLDAACLVVMIVSCAMLVGPGFWGLAPSCSYVGCALAGFSIGWLYTRWAGSLSRVFLRELIRRIFTGAICWTIARAALYALPPFSSMICAMLIALLAYGLLKTAESALCDSSSTVAAPTDDSQLTAWRFWVVIVVLTLVAQLLLGETSAHLRGAASIAYPLKALASIGLYCALLYWTLKTNLAFDFVLLWRRILILEATTLLIVALLKEGFSLWILAGITADVLVPVVWLTVCAIAHRASLPRCLTVSIGLGAYGGASFIGIALGGVVPSLMGAAPLGVLLLFFLLVVLAVCLDPRNSDLLQLFEDLRGKIVHPTEFAGIEASCKRIGTEHRLTPREIEVMQMLCMGRSRSYVAETLFISENTVKTHIDRLYKKLDVHNREELQEVVGI